MSLTSCFRLLTLFLLAAFAGAAAENDGTSFSYARDDRAELILTVEGETTQFELRLFGKSPENGQIVWESGELRALANNRFLYEEDAVDENAPAAGRRTVQITGTLGGSTLEVEVSGLKTVAGDRADLGGTYRQITAAERLQRARQRFDATDAVLNNTYQKARSEVGEAGQEKLRDSQRQWIAHRDYLAEWGKADDPKTRPEYWDEMLDLTASRIDFLRLFSGKGLPKGITGAYRDGFGGELHLEETKAGLLFEIEVVRGPTAHTGDLSGAAQRKEGKAFFKERLEPVEDRQPAELTFTFSDGHIVTIEGKNTEYYHGARAHFDGTYFKSAPLEKSLAGEKEKVE